MMNNGQQTSPANSRGIIISHDVLKTFLFKLKRLVRGIYAFHIGINMTIKASYLISL